MIQNVALRQLISPVKLSLLGTQTTIRKSCRLVIVVLAFIIASSAHAEFSFQKTDSSLQNNSSDLQNNNPGSQLSSFSTESEPEFLRVHEAFKTNLSIEDNKIIAQWQIADEYYMYRDRFKFQISDGADDLLGSPIFDHKGKIKLDEIFGEVEVFTHQVTVTIPINDQSNNPIKQPFEVVATFQGCADAGLCYPPTKFKQTFSIDSGSSTANSLPSNPTKSALSNATKNTNAEKSSAPPRKKSPNKEGMNDAEGISGMLQNASLLGIVGICLLIGIGLTFTPCILPMIPILSSIIVGQNGKLSTARGFVLSSVYVIGMASTYAAIGILFALSGKRIVLYMQNPVVLFTFAGIFILLAISMFGFYELQLPEKLRSKLDSVNQKQKGGTLIGVFVMGILAALLASPCVSAPLAGVLLFISTADSVLLGGIALFSIGLGIGLPLIVLGTTGTNILPKAGGWMNTVKSFFGVIMLALAAYFVKHLLPGPIMMVIWASLLIVPAIYMGAGQTLDGAASGWQKLWKGLGIMMMIYGAALIIGAAGGRTNPLQPLELKLGGQTENSTKEHLNFTRVTSIPELESQLKQATQNGQPVMLDYYADWCIACVEMEHDAFQNPKVVRLLSSHHLIQVDLTSTNDADKLLDKYSLIGPPSILFFDMTGTENRDARVVGEMKSARFTRHLQQHVILN